MDMRSIICPDPGWRLRPPSLPMSRALLQKPFCLDHNGSQVTVVVSTIGSREQKGLVDFRRRAVA
jgi:hypothetical protein